MDRFGDGFVGASIDRGPPSAAPPGAFGFFGDLSGVAGEALEDGLEAPPEEAIPLPGTLHDGGDGDDGMGALGMGAADALAADGYGGDSDIMAALEADIDSAVFSGRDDDGFGLGGALGALGGADGAAPDLRAIERELKRVGLLPDAAPGPGVTDAPRPTPPRSSLPPGALSVAEVEARMAAAARAGPSPGHPPSSFPMGPPPTLAMGMGMGTPPPHLPPMSPAMSMGMNMGMGMGMPPPFPGMPPPPGWPGMPPFGPGHSPMGPPHPPGGPMPGPFPFGPMPPRPGPPFSPMPSPGPHGAPPPGTPPPGTPPPRHAPPPPPGHAPHTPRPPPGAATPPAPSATPPPHPRPPAPAPAPRPAPSWPLGGAAPRPVAVSPAPASLRDIQREQAAEREEERGKRSIAVADVPVSFLPSPSLPAPPPGTPPRNDADRRPAGKHMLAAEVNHVMRILWSGVHSLEIYYEDYYFQAWLNKNNPGINRLVFTPPALRETDDASMRVGQAIKFMELQGLGRIPVQNIRRPKPLMDVSTAELEEQQRARDASNTNTNNGNNNNTDTHPNGKNATSRPSAAMDQDPLLAARVMMENCMHVLLDVDDLDRKVMARDAPVPKAALQHRAKMMESVADALQAHARPSGTDHSQSDEGAVKTSDDMFRRVCLLRKGRNVLAKAVAALVPPYPTPPSAPAPSHRLLWAALRCARRTFRHTSLPLELLPSAEDARVVAREGDLATPTWHVARALVRAVGTLRDAAALGDALEALCEGDLVLREGEEVPVVDLLLPLRPDGDPDDPRIANREWLGSVLVAIMERAQEVGAAGDPRWGGAFAKIYGVVQGHLTTVAQVYRAAKEANAPSACRRAVAEVPVAVVVALLGAMQPHMTEEQGRALAASLSEVFEGL